MYGYTGYIYVAIYFIRTESNYHTVSISNVLSDWLKCLIGMNSMMSYAICKPFIG